MAPKSVVSVMTALMALVVVGCDTENSPNSANSGSFFLWGALERTSYADTTEVEDEVFVAILSDPLIRPSELSVNLGDTSLHVGEEGQGFIASVDEDFPMAVGETYTLSTVSDAGNVTASAVLPGDFDITSPERGGTVYVGQDLSVSWTPSESAQWYIVWVEAGYWDSEADDWVDQDTLVVATQISVVIPATFLGAQSDGIWIDVAAGNGPAPTTGSSGNVHGDGRGFLLGIHHRSVWVHFGRSSPARLGKPATRQERRGRLLQLHGFPGGGLN